MKPLAALFQLSLALGTLSQDCSASSVSEYDITALPDPFTFTNGSTVETASDWTCRRQEIASLIQHYEAGYLPPKPSQLTSTFSKSGTKGTLAIIAGEAGKTVSFSSTIVYPSGTPPADGWPLLITYEGGGLPALSGVSGCH